MKNFLYLLVAPALLASTAASAAVGDPWLGFRAGATLPVGELRDAAGPGLQWSLLSSFTTGDNVELELDLAYHDWRSTSLDQYFLAIAGPGAQSKLRAWQASVHIVRYAPTLGAIRPYAKGGFGATAFQARVEFPGSRFRTEETALGFNTDLGAGFTVDVTSRLRVGIGGMYQVVGVQAEMGHVFSMGLQLMTRP